MGITAASSIVILKYQRPGVRGRPSPRLPETAKAMMSKGPEWRVAERAAVGGTKVAHSGQASLVCTLYPLSVFSSHVYPFLSFQIFL